MNDIVQYDLHGNPIEEHPHSDIGRHRVFVTNGASNHSKGERQEDDFYATDPVAAEWLLKLEKIAGPIWEPCCGHGDLSKVFVEHGFDVKSTDLVDRGYGEGGVDFLSSEIKSWDGCIITNPPFKFAQEIIEKALQIVPDGKKIYMFLRLLFLEGMRRGEMFRRCPPKKIWVTSKRIICAKNGDFANNTGGAQAYIWAVWEKGFNGETTLGWFN